MKEIGEISCDRLPPCFQVRPGLDSLNFPVRPQRCLQGRAMASYRDTMSVPLKSVDHLTSAERAGLAEASRKVRPNARQRRQFAELRQARNELCRSRADSKKAVTGLGHGDGFFFCSTVSIRRTGRWSAQSVKGMLTAAPRTASVRGPSPLGICQDHRTGTPLDRPGPSNLRKTIEIVPECVRQLLAELIPHPAEC